MTIRMVRHRNALRLFGGKIKKINKRRFIKKFPSVRSHLRPIIGWRNGAKNFRHTFGREWSAFLDAEFRTFFSGRRWKNLERPLRVFVSAVHTPSLGGVVFQDDYYVAKRPPKVTVNVISVKGTSVPFIRPCRFLPRKNTNRPYD